MRQHEFHGRRRVLPQPWAIHRLHEVSAKIERSVCVHVHAQLRKDKFQLIAGFGDELGSRFGRDAHPIDASGDGDRAVGLYGNFKPIGVQFVEQPRIGLQEGLTARENLAFAARASGGDIEAALGAFGLFDYAALPARMSSGNRCS